MRVVRPGGLTVVSLCVLALATCVTAGPRALPQGELPKDRRLGDLQTLNGYFPFTTVKSPQAWKRRSEQLRRQVLVATGLWPLPTRTPSKPVIHGRVDRQEYTVERVFLQSFPGHFVTGSLFRPRGRSGKLPAVLCPHGHWPEGRFYDCGPERACKEIAIGAERFEVGGRYPLQARCVQLARMGCVVFHYDMVGYADSVQLDHRPGMRPEMNTDSDWGFFSPQAELRLQNMMGLQTWNSIRALDFLLSLPEVDAKRVGVTGASGGGTQTFILNGVDERPAVAFPAVMVSTAMQGGCTCENACYLRVGAGNIDIAALTAPRALAMTGADDWTVEIMTKGLPELKALYKMLGKESFVHAEAFVHFKHNYNSVSRTVMYDWFNRQLKLGFKEPVLEHDYVPLSREELTVWTKKHPQPSGAQVGAAHERALLKWMTGDTQKQLAALAPNNAKSLAEFRRVVGGGLDVLIGRRLEDVGKLDYRPVKEQDKGDYRQVTALLTHTAKEEQLPLLLLCPKSGINKQAVVWICDRGKDGLLADNGKPTDEATRLLKAGYTVIGVDLLYQGEFLADGKPLEKARMVSFGENPPAWREYAGYTFGYNHPLFSQRVHDLLTVIKYLRSQQFQAKAVHLVGLGRQAGPLVAAARMQAQAAVAKAAVDTAGFRFQTLKHFEDPMFLPGAVKYHDVPGILALSAPYPLWLAGEKNPAIVRQAYKAAGKADQLTVQANGDAATAVSWLLK